MSGPTFEQWRIPVALVLIIVALFIFLPRIGDSGPILRLVSPTPEPSIVVGAPGGAVEPTSAPPTPTPTPVPTPQPTPRPTPAPQTAGGGFDAQVLACRAISGSQCRGELGTLPPNAGAFTALVRFSNARAGDTLNVVLVGPGGTIAGGPYTLGGGGDGYYYSTFNVGGLPRGQYTLIATRNGNEVAETRFRRGGRG
jgi:hypothetical protein